MSNLHFSNWIVRPKKFTYGEWWESPIKGASDEGMDEAGGVTHGMYVVDFYRSLRHLLISHGYDITNEKEFKSEIATLIYNLSDDHL